MRILPSLHQIVEIKASSQLVNFVSLLIDNVISYVWQRVVRGTGVIYVKSIISKPWAEIVVQIETSILIHRLRIRVIVLWTIVHVIHVVIWVSRVHLTFLARVFELFYLKSLLNQNILHVVWQIIYLKPRLLILLGVFRLPNQLKLQVFCLYLIEQSEFRFADDSLGFLWVLAVGILVIIVPDEIIILVAFLRFQSQRKITH